ncbi:copper resistance D family protein [Frondihabitans sp. VKM Ac-2883]|uniref:copper resistance D family protein n=1 Tax=Frondihabitans sp. VKM Ac-2883 TaxID=2783823 RepID=UPI00188B7952|nr:CopD family protein [Frondihabitans sp. VKM Ac-2883]MBF4575469.1 CopD family protein [Frondihabitans sp. VKM Ac-2883]
MTLGLAAAVTLAVVVVVLVAIKPAELVLIVDPGEIVRTGYTLSKALSNLAAAVTIGSAFLVATALPAHKAAHRSMFRLIRTAALVWAGAGVIASVFTFASISGIAIENATKSGFWSQASYYATDIELGQGWTATILVAVVIAIWSSIARPTTGHAAVLALIGIGGLVPLAQQGHAASSASHNLAVVSILMHVAFASVWLGGLVGIVWLRRTLPARLLPIVLRRYSTTAMMCFFAVALSGLVSATLRITDLTALTSTSYGLILLGKMGVLLILGALGASFRTKLLPLIETGRSRTFWVLVTVEVAFMGIASGLAAVLARTAPPGAEQEIYDTGPVTAAESLTGAPFPAAPTWSTLFSVQPDPVWIFAITTTGILYIRALQNHARQGHTWRRTRMTLFVVGLALTLWVTCGPLSIYATYTVSAYTASLVLLLAAGVLLAAGQPGSLAAATLPAEKTPPVVQANAPNTSGRRPCAMSSPPPQRPASQRE